MKEGLNEFIAFEMSRSREEIEEEEEERAGQCDGWWWSPSLHACERVRRECPFL